MKLLISVSSVVKPFKKGDRVVVKIKINEWYIGTVESFGKRLKIAFDDGDEIIFDTEDLSKVKLMVKRKKLRRALTLIEAKSLFVVPKVVRKVTKTKVQIVPLHLVPKVAQPLEPYLQCGDADLFAQSTTPARKIHYLQEAYAKALYDIFQGNMLQPKIYLLKNQKIGSFRGRGVWKSGTRELGVSPRLFLAGESHVLTTLIHEMCHQAVTDIDRVVDRENGGHGRHWEAWMHKTGIPPSRYDTTDPAEFMTEDEKENHQQLKDSKESNTRGLVKTHYKGPGQPAMFFSTRESKMIKGIVIGIVASKMFFLSSLTSRTTWIQLPNKGAGWLYDLPPSEEASYRTTEWQEALVEITEVIRQNAEIKSSNTLIRKFNKMLLGNHR